jgi:hypothetical protein
MRAEELAEATPPDEDQANDEEDTAGPVTSQP